MSDHGYALHSVCTFPTFLFPCLTKILNYLYLQPYNVCVVYNVLSYLNKNIAQHCVRSRHRQLKTLTSPDYSMSRRRNAT